MAPEVVLKKPYNEKADIFSLGCCMFEVCVAALFGGCHSVTPASACDGCIF